MFDEEKADSKQAKATDFTVNEAVVCCFDVNSFLSSRVRRERSKSLFVIVSNWINSLIDLMFTTQDI